MTGMWWALGVFVVTYILMIALPKFRPFIALASAVVFVVSGMLSIENVLPSVDFNVLMMIAGTMGTVTLVIESQLPALMADLLLERVPNVKWAIVVLSLFAGIVSAFIDNVATLLMIAPVALAIAKKLDINPVGMIIAIAVSSNLQGAATLVGDTTSIMLAGEAGMNFNDFFWYEGKPGIFFAVELGALVSVFILLVLFRKEKGKVTTGQRTAVKDFVPGLLLLGTVLALIVASFFKESFHIVIGGQDLTNGIICMGFMLIALVYSGLRNKNLNGVRTVLEEFDWQTVLLLFGLFIVIGGIEEQGVIAAIASVLANIRGGIFVVYTVVVFASVVISAFVDNIPYVATMLPVMTALASSLGISPTILYFGLLCGATLGGNITPIGASANIAGIGILRKEGYEVKNKDFFRIGIPFTLGAVLSAYVYVWVVFYVL